MKILVTGANGQLGQTFRFIQKQLPGEVFFASKESLDITDKDALKEYIITKSIDTVINCAAYTDVESAEINYKTAFNVNAYGIRNIGEVVKEYNDGLVIHISTDYVFDGNTNTPYLTSSKTNPINMYGLSKKVGEELLIGTGCRNIIIRTSWLYSEFEKNFFNTIDKLLEEKQSINVISDQIGTPTYTFDLAYAVRDILKCKYPKTGIYHYSSEGFCTWYEFAQAIRIFTNRISCNIEPCKTEDFSSAVLRPKYSVLSNSKIKLDYGINPPHWMESLRYLCEGKRVNQYSEDNCKN